MSVLFLELSIYKLTPLLNQFLLYYSFVFFERKNMIGHFDLRRTEIQLTDPQPAGIDRTFLEFLVK